MSCYNFTNCSSPIPKSRRTRAVDPWTNQRSVITRVAGEARARWAIITQQGDRRKGGWGICLPAAGSCAIAQDWLPDPERPSATPGLESVSLKVLIVRTMPILTLRKRTREK
jgi:hypothetical protein